MACASPLKDGPLEKMDYTDLKRQTCCDESGSSDLLHEAFVFWDILHDKDVTEVMIDGLLVVTDAK